MGDVAAAVLGFRCRCCDGAQNQPAQANGVARLRFGRVRAYSAYCPTRIAVRLETAVSRDSRSPDERTFGRSRGGSFLAIDREIDRGSSCLIPCAIKIAAAT